MRIPWNKPKVEQRDLVDEANEELVERLMSDAVEDGADAQAPTASTTSALDASAAEGRPLRQRLL